MPLVWRDIEIAHARLGLFVPKEPDALLDALTQEEFDRADQKMPYWAILWPSAFALAQAIVRGGGLGGRRVLDLGCGLGLEGLAALARGAHVTFLDWEADAVALARASAWANGFVACDTVVADWRHPPALEPFDLVLAADVLYEERNAPAVAAFFMSHLRAGGEAWIVDPGRRHAERFEDVVAAARLRVLGKQPLPPFEEAKALVLWRLGRARE